MKLADSSLNARFVQNAVTKAIGVALVGFSCLSGSALAQATDAQTYPAAFFDQYTPQNALEMIERLPGFSFDQGDNKRGFGGNAGNVLIDGARPASKSGGLRGALSRIPAAQVIRIEILRGGVGAGEAAGQSTVANVIRAQTGSSGTWAAKLRAVENANVEPNIEGTVTGKYGEWDASFDGDIGGRPGYRHAIIDTEAADGQLLRSSDEVLLERSRWAFFNGEGSREFEAGKLTLNGRLGGDKWRGDFERKQYNGRRPDEGAADGSRIFNERNSFEVAEFGADWTQTNDDWKWRMIGLGVVNETDFTISAAQTGAHNSQFDFQQERLKKEFILRSTYSKVGGGDFQAGVPASKWPTTFSIPAVSFVENGSPGDFAQRQRQN